MNDTGGIAINTGDASEEKNNLERQLAKAKTAHCPYE